MVEEAAAAALLEIFLQAVAPLVASAVAPLVAVALGEAGNPLPVLIRN